ncbi:hypothetical protein BG32_11740, partial [Mesotoga sp. HF07.pep.5.2.highcov]|uniref:hypothetical protein n=1 Tax=Mesotoga sp. HF07.pep.5.2.highcov TaxID=1462923 RepID=UPI000FF6DF78
SNSYHYGSYKSSPPLTVQEHGPVHRKDLRSDPEEELFRKTSCVGSDQIAFLSHNELVLVLCS